MGQRGSLRQCVAICYGKLKRGAASELNIVRVPGGKYYTVETNEEVAARIAAPGGPAYSVIFHGTIGELEALVLNEQLRLFGKA